MNMKTAHELLAEQQGDASPGAIARLKLYQSLTINREADHAGRAIPHTSVMDVLFAKLDAAYPHKWRSAYPTPADRDIWLKVWSERLTCEGVDDKRIRLALSQIGKVCTGFVPTLEEFITASTPIIDYESAYEFAALQWLRRQRHDGSDVWDRHKLAHVSTEALFWAASMMHAELQEGKSYRSLKHRWRIVLDEQLAEPKLKPIPSSAKPQIPYLDEVNDNGSNMPILGKTTPTILDATAEELGCVHPEIRALYQRLRLRHFDIALTDPLLSHWVANSQQAAIELMVSTMATRPHSPFIKNMWYTPDDFGMRARGLDVA